MSFLFKQSILGTAVDPVGPGGKLIEAPTELTQPGILPAGWIIVADGAGGWTVGPQDISDNRYLIQLTHHNGVPAGGTRYLRVGQNIVTSSAGFHLPKDSTLRSITLQVNVVDNLRSYNIEVLKDPAGRLGAPVVLATLPLATGSLNNIANTLAVNVVAADELGARIVRATGTGRSSFRRIVVITEWSIP